jgi:hypothetical protein
MCCSFTSSRKPYEKNQLVVEWLWIVYFVLKEVSTSKVNRHLEDLGCTRSYLKVFEPSRMFSFVNLFYLGVTANTLLHVRPWQIGCERTLSHWTPIKCNLLYVHSLDCLNLRQYVISTWNCAFTCPSKLGEYSQHLPRGKTNKGRGGEICWLWV